MKKKLALFGALFLLLSSNVNAKINNDYNTSADYANKYIQSFKDNDKYILKSSGSFIIPFSYENGTLSTNNLYKNGGMISLTEFKSTFVNDDSYLLSGQEYWTLTSKDSDSNYFVTYNGESYKNLSRDSGLRVTEHIEEGAKVYGKGTYNDPWTFSPKYNVIVKNTTPSYGNVTAVSNVVYGGDSAKIVLEPKPGYEYASDTCSGMIGYSRSENNVIINDVEKDILCSFTFKPKSFSVSYDSNGGSVCNPSSNVQTIGSSYNLNCTPTRNGFNFDGWYTELDGGTKLTTTTKITNYNDHSIYAHWTAKPITLSNQSFQAYYSSAQINFAMVSASGGSGLYTYTITGANSSKFSISANTIYVTAGTGVGTYTLTVTATDNYSGATATATFTISIKQQTTTTRATTTRTTTTTTRYVTVRTTTRDYDYTTRRTTTRNSGNVTTRTTTRNGGTVTTRTTTKATTKKTTTKATTKKTTTKATTKKATTKATTKKVLPCQCTGNNKLCQGGYICSGNKCCA